jgi:hypothetical protein
MEIMSAAGEGQMFSLVASLKMTTPQLGWTGSIQFLGGVREVLCPRMFQVKRGVDPADPVDKLVTVIANRVSRFRHLFPVWIQGLRGFFVQRHCPTHRMFDTAIRIGGPNIIIFGGYLYPIR